MSRALVALVLGCVLFLLGYYAPWRPQPDATAYARGYAAAVDSVRAGPRTNVSLLSFSYYVDSVSVTAERNGLRVSGTLKEGR